MPSPSYELAHCIVCGHTDAEVVATADDITRRSRMAVGVPSETAASRRCRRQRLDGPRCVLGARRRSGWCGATSAAWCIGILSSGRARADRVLRAEHAAPDVLRSLHDTQLVASRTQARRYCASVRARGTGLEVGSYVGAFLAAARDEGLQLKDSTSTPRSTNSRDRWVSSARWRAVDVLDRRGRFDAVAIWNTFDQLADPRGAVHSARKLLRAGGVLALRVPNGAFYAATRTCSMRGPRQALVRSGDSRAEQSVDFPYRWGFTPPSLARLLYEIEVSRSSIFAATGSFRSPTSGRGLGRALRKLSSSARSQRPCRSSALEHPGSRFTPNASEPRKRISRSASHWRRNRSRTAVANDLRRTTEVLSAPPRPRRAPWPARAARFGRSGRSPSTTGGR